MLPPCCTLPFVRCFLTMRTTLNRPIANLNPENIATGDSELGMFSILSAVGAFGEALKELQKRPKFQPGAERLWRLGMAKLEGLLRVRFFGLALEKLHNGESLSDYETRLFNEVVDVFLVSRSIPKVTREGYRKQLVALNAWLPTGTRLCEHCAHLHTTNEELAPYCSTNCVKARKNSQEYLNRLAGIAARRDGGVFAGKLVRNKRGQS